MTLRILDVEQRSEVWYEARRGIVTASIVGKLLTVRKLGALDFDCPDCGANEALPCRSKVKRAGEVGADIKTPHPARVEVASRNKATVIEPASNDDSRAVTLTLAAERINNFTEPTFVTDAMFRGVLEEPVARDLYSQHYAPVTEFGFMVRQFDNGSQLGLSPDGLVGDDGGIEIKSRGPKKHLATVLSGTVPSENVAQIQAALLVTGRAWWDYVSFCSGMRLFVIRVYPDDRWHRAIIAAVRQFEDNASSQVALYKELTHGLPMTERIDHHGEIRVA